MTSGKARRMADRQKASFGKRVLGMTPTGITKQNVIQRAELKLGTKYLRQDIAKGISSKVIVLKITNNNPKTPFEHLTLRRIDSILY